jgi:hypothetical protein
MSYYTDVMERVGSRVGDALKPVTEPVADWWSGLNAAQTLVILGGLMAYALYVAWRAPRAYAGGPHAWTLAFAMGVTMISVAAFGLTYAWAVLTAG